MKKSLVFLGIDTESALLLATPYIQGFDVKIYIEEEEIFLEGVDVKKAFDAIKLVFGDKVVFLENLGEFLVASLRKKQKKITTAESCTGGLLAYQFTSIAGASDVYDGGIISYANEIKNRYLQVGEENLRKYGAVSEIVVNEMLNGALQMFGADYALATSGIAGPGGGSVEKPVGTVFVGVKKVGQNCIIEKYLLDGDRNQIQKATSLKALELLAKIL